ncbi:MAG UNVERIFIED_CONTAM: hypothetical protein LVT10_14500 [Anaerolineae bacterium]
MMRSSVANSVLNCWKPSKELLNWVFLRVSDQRLPTMSAPAWMNEFEAEEKPFMFTITLWCLSAVEPIQLLEHPNRHPVGYRFIGTCY